MNRRRRSKRTRKEDEEENEDEEEKEGICSLHAPDNSHSKQHHYCTRHLHCLGELPHQT